MKNFIFVLVFLSSFTCFAQQFSKDFWHKGEIYTFAGEHIEGEIFYDLEKESVQIRLPNATVQTFSSQKLEAFQFFDVIEKKPRIFYTLPYKLVGNYEKPTFFELLSEGKIHLLNRESIRQRSVPDMFYGGWIRTEYYIEDSFFVLQNDKVFALQPTKNALESLFGKDWKAVEEWIKQQSLGTKKRQDLIQIFDFYNRSFAD